MAGESPFAPGYEAPPPPERPRLGIIHMLLWMTCVAVYMGIHRTILLAAGNEVPMGSDSAWWVPYGICVGAVWAGALVGIRLLRQGLAFPIHPGEYLLIAMTLGTLLSTAGQAIVLILRDIAGFAQTRGPMMLLYFVVYIAMACLYAWAARRVKVRRWQAFFLVKGVSGLIYACIFCLPYFWMRRLGVEQVICMALLTYAVFRDARQRKRYPWTHWLPVACQYWFMLQTVLLALWYSVLGR